ncbi:hypothetical protein N7509_003291 [Penicillium cosmopolitanum]|uniref:Major facilitator superfamily (MFS) profile domain-containing protein n=1 Tax=Penicillium cosmopolitanum TaxID=1131564 RepID=A0A9X0BB89_9EURO|nr:uncharacterized protein N7509_003291 [Penicillium cosmopolitanum]KAJ5403420.1 hypothetical protein N7509_003291 [Penicillium cosmopolitanum]
MSMKRQGQSTDTPHAPNSSREPNDTLSGDEYEEKYPDGGLKAWLVVVGAFAMLICTFGMMSSVGVLQSYWQTHQLKSYPSSTVGWIPSVFVFFNLMLGIQIGPMFDRYGPRWIILTGSLLYVLSFFLLAECKEYYQFMLCMSGLGGISSSLISTPTMASISHWFHKRRGLATGIAMAGASIGGILFPIILRHVIDRLGWPWAMRIMGFIFVILLTIGNLCVKGRLPPKAGKGTIDMKCFSDSRFVWTTAGAFFSEIVLFASLGLVPSYAVAQGFGSGTGTYLLVVLNAGSAVGRLLAGLTSDHFGAFNTMAVIISVTTVLIFGLWVPLGHYIGVLYPFSFMLGLGTGSFLSLTPVFGTLVGIPIAGELLQVAGPTRLAAVLGGIFGLALVNFMIARWSCLKWEWKWWAKV